MKIASAEPTLQMTTNSITKIKFQNILWQWTMKSHVKQFMLEFICIKIAFQPIVNTNKNPKKTHTFSFVQQKNIYNILNTSESGTKFSGL